MGKILFKQSNGLIRIIQTLLHQKQQLRGGILTLNTVVQTLMILESNQQSAEWTAAGESRPKQVKMQISVGKVLASVFWDAPGILFINYLEKERTINSKYYITLLINLKEEIIKKLLQMKKKWSFTKTMHCVTSRSQQWQNYMNCTSNCFLTHLLLLIWPPADLKERSRKRDLTPMKVISETEAYFKAKDKSFDKKGIELLEKHWNQFITLEGDYVDE